MTSGLDLEKRILGIPVLYIDLAPEYSSAFMAEAKMQTQNEKVAILGASRGLGAALVQHVCTLSPSPGLFLSSRKITWEESNTPVHVHPADFTKAADQEHLLAALREFAPHRIFYVAGGGPFGPFQDKSWPSHQWALELNLLFPAKLLHFALGPARWSPLRQIAFVGSEIAGEKPDPMSASYAAGKHGLKGLVTSVAQENPDLDVRVFNAGYMNTDLLPANAWPRQQGLAEDPAVVARRLWQWAGNFVSSPAKGDPRGSR